jgi:hypothetical protein
MASIDENRILPAVDNPEFVTIPTPVVTIENLNSLLTGIATHLNRTEDVTIEKLDGDTQDEVSAESLREQIPEPVIAGTTPIINTIKVAADMEMFDETQDFSIEDRISDILTHETLHIILYHIEGRETSVALDNISDSKYGL